MKKSPLLFILFCLLTVFPQTANAQYQLNLPEQLAVKWKIDFDVNNGQLEAIETVSLHFLMTDGTYQPTPVPPAIYYLNCQEIGYVSYTSEEAIFTGEGFIACDDIDLVTAAQELADQLSGWELPDTMCLNGPTEGCYIRAYGVHVEADVKASNDGDFPIFSYKHIQLSEKDQGGHGDIFWTINGNQDIVTHTYPTSGLYADYSGAFLTQWHVVEATQLCPIYVLFCTNDFSIGTGGYGRIGFIGMLSGQQYYEYHAQPSSPIFIGYDPNANTYANGEFRGGIIDPTAVCGTCGM